MARRRNGTYYHGTREEYLERIQERGLSYPFLASLPSQAWCWGRSYSNEPDGKDVRILEVVIDDEGRVVPDYNLMDSEDRERALGADWAPRGGYFDVREVMVDSADDLIEGARRFGAREVDDRECGGEASIYLGDVPPNSLREVDRRGRPVREEIDENPPRRRFVVRSVRQGLDLIRRPEIARNFEKALRWRPRNRLAVLVPCAGTKPFPEAPSHKRGYLAALKGKAADLWVVSEPLGVVPYSFSETWPNDSYDFPPKFLRDEAWDALVERVAEWLERVAPKYRKVFVALPGHHERLLRAALELYNPGNLRDATHSQCLDSGACPPGHGRATSTKYRRYLDAVVRNPRSNHEQNPAADDGRYVFIHSCPSSTGEDIQMLRDSERRITRQTFVRKLAPGEWARIQEALGYDKYCPINKADWQIPYFKGVYRGVPAVFLEWSAMEYIFTLDGELGPSAGTPDTTNLAPRKGERGWRSL